MNYLLILEIHNFEIKLKIEISNSYINNVITCKFKGKKTTKYLNIVNIKT